MGRLVEAKALFSCARIEAVVVPRDWRGSVTNQATPILQIRTPPESWHPMAKTVLLEVLVALSAKEMLRKAFEPLDNHVLAKGLWGGERKRALINLVKRNRYK